MSRINFYLPDSQSGRFTIRITHNYKAVFASKGLNFYIEDYDCILDGNTIIDSYNETLKELILESRLQVEVQIPKALRSMLGRDPSVGEIKNEYLLRMGVASPKVTFEQERKGMLFFDVWIEYIEFSKDKVGRSTYNHRIQLSKLFKAFCDSVNVECTFEGVNHSVFERFRDYCRLEHHYSDNTIGKHFKGLKEFMNWSVKKGYTDVAGHKDVDIKIDSVPADIVVYSPEELQSILDLDLSDHPTLEHSRDILIAGCFTGLRVGDLLSIAHGSVFLNDMDIQKSYLRITPSKTKKSGKTVVIPITPELSNILRKYKDQYKFALPTHNHSGAKINPSRLRSDIREISKLSGIVGESEKRVMRNGEFEIETRDRSTLFSPHRMRATFITIMLRAGVPSEQVMKMSGHSDYNSFKRYIQFTDVENEKAIMKAFGGFVKSA